MTLQEALGKITDPEVRAFFDKMVADQNRYITQLETQLKDPKVQGASTTKQQPQPTTTDDVTKQFILRKMREETIAKAVDQIVAAYGKDVYQAIAKEYAEFLDANMTPERTNHDYAVDAFNLVFGRCCANKDHPVHQALGKGVQNPGATPSATASGTNGPSIAAVQNVIAGQPQVMTGDDINAGQGLPGVQGAPVKDTKDAFARFKERAMKSGSGKFQ